MLEYPAAVTTSKKPMVLSDNDIPTYNKEQRLTIIGSKDHQDLHFMNFDDSYLFTTTGEDTKFPVMVGNKQINNLCISYFVHTERIHHPTKAPWIVPRFYRLSFFCQSQQLRRTAFYG